MSKIKRIIIPFIWAVVLSLIIATPVMAVPDDMTILIANPSNTSIILTWTIPAGSTSTVIRYSTAAFPANPAAGTGAYAGAGYQTTLSSLVAGTTYFFSAWGYDGANYSATVFNLAVTTTAVAMPSGAETTANTGPGIPAPVLPASIVQVPDESAFNLEPFTSIISYFNSGTGGLGMPVENAWETLVIMGIVTSGMFTYMKTKIFFLAFGVVFALTVGATVLELVQGFLVVIEIVVAAGVWAIDKYAQ